MYIWSNPFNHNNEQNQRSGGTTGESYEALRTQYETIAAAHSELDVTHQNTLAKLKSLEQSNEQLAYELSIATASYAEAVQLLDTKHAVEVTEALDGKLIRESVSALYLFHWRQLFLMVVVAQYQRLGTSVLQVLECEVCYNIIEAPYMYIFLFAVI